jgi:hypothetical protein
MEQQAPSPFPFGRRELRASDEERERTAATLREAHAEGRLETHELDERVGLAYRARTRGDLAALVRDLPGVHRARMRTFHRRAWRAAMVTYLTFNAWMVGIWAATGSHFFWPIWTLLPGGLALLGARARGEAPPQRRLGRGGPAGGGSH